MGIRLFAPMLAIAGLAFAACGNGTSGDDATSNGSPTATDNAEATATPRPPAEIFEQRFGPLWPDTDFTRSTVDPSEIISGGVSVDGIPPLDAENATSEPARRSGTARFAPASSPVIDYERQIPVAAVKVNGEARAYPLHILMWHETVNDEIAGIPVAVTFCPLCNTALSFDRRVDGRVLDFGVSGLLRFSDLIMWDRQTQSWWQQATGEGIVGDFAGTQLPFISTRIISFGDFLDAYPNALVLTEETGLNQAYGLNPYQGYDTASSPFLFGQEADPRLAPMERVVGLVVDGEAVAVPFSVLSEARTANLQLAGESIAVFWAPGTTTALGDSDIAASRDVGSGVAYDAVVDGQRLTFEPVDDGLFRDAESGSTWNITGKAVDGPLAEATLTPVNHGNHFWFAFAAFHPETTVWESQ